MATIHKTDIDLNKNQILNARLHNTAFTPSSPVVGQIIYNTTLNEPLVWNGSVWKSLFNLPLSGGTLTGPLILNGPLTLNDIGTSTPVNNLGVDINGNVVVGTSDGSMTITPITYIDLMSLKTGNSLAPGVRYYITDRDIWIDALDTDKLALECKRHFRIVKDEYYTPSPPLVTTRYLGIYGQGYARGSTPNSSRGGTTYYAIWGGRMWRRTEISSDVPGLDNETIAGGWTLRPTTDNDYYESKIFDIKYDFDDDIIWEQSDDRGNKIKRINSTTSYIDITDWGNVDIYNNENFGIFNNFRNATTKATIYNNSNNGSIQGNSNDGIINNNSNNGNIISNKNTGNIQNNTNNGTIRNNSNNVTNIHTNSNLGDIQNNTNIGVISYNTNLGYINDNSNNNAIYRNSNLDSINNNSNSGTINENSNNGVIDNNSNNGSIRFNSNNGTIQDNSNNGSIDNNSNIGYISNNSNVSGTTHIQFNTNNGWISGNSMNGSYKLEYNYNNGRIGVASGTITRNADITDTIVNKP